ncbi:MAG: ABC transporter permease [Bacteroidota bacterium]|nr:ABC transporter permease [Bacteroidota bacterium]MDP4211418.1 ABC transporter permease [Bacteroidota bacterium]MDP4248645.1 ABC transporter permease [Bacteroidota bacterium]
MQNIPSTSTIFSSLLRADLTTQWRNRKSFMLILIVPVIILFSWKGVIDKLGGAFVLGTCITLGLIAIGLMGYSNSIARDRDKGIFQRLRVAPLPAWSVMSSRLLVQMLMILLLTSTVFIAGFYFDKISLSAGGYLLGYVAALVGGAVYLGIGQMIVGLIKNAETVHSTSRLVYFVFIMVGMFGELGILGTQIGHLVQWSPYGTVKHILASSFQAASWDLSATKALLITIGYAIIFSVLGIRWFKWSPSERG